MRRYIGCDIQVEKAASSDPQAVRTVTITGTPQQVQLAQNVILNKIQRAAASQMQRQKMADPRRGHGS